MKVVWRKELHQELTGTRAEVIVGGGKAYLGTYAGNMYAWDAHSGQRQWVYHTRGPIMHSPMYDAGILYFASMDRRVYALNAQTGKEKWTFEADEGFWFSGVCAPAPRARAWWVTHSSHRTVRCVAIRDTV